MITSKQIYLIITEGCESCKIMERILKQVCKDNNYTFSIQIATYESVPDFIKMNVILTDFPTLVFLTYDIIKYHITGTISAKNLKRIIEDLQFK